MPENYSLDFKAGGMVAVKADCNTGNGSYKVDGNKITFGPIGMTMMMCKPGSLDSQFLKGLGSAKTFKQKTATLTIKLASGGGTMAFTRASENPLLNTQWRWENTQTPVETITPTVSRMYTLEFLAGKVNVKADCNSGSGTYKVEGNSITFGPIGMTRMMCPAGSLDTKFLQQLSAVRTFDVNGISLRMSMVADGGTMQYSSMRTETYNPLQGTKWNWVSSKSGSTTIAVPTPKNYSLDFLTDKVVAAQLDCNKGNGSYTVSGNNITFGNMAATMMMCPPGSLSSTFSQQLGKARTYKINGDRLTFTLEGESGTMTFARPTN